MSKMNNEESRRNNVRNWRRLVDASFAISSFGLRPWDFFRHSSFVIRHFRHFRHPYTYLCGLAKI
jgi:hypothetical protein